MSKQSDSLNVVFFAFLGNLFITGGKLLVALFTRSTAMLAEAVHSLADTLNQAFLWVGLRRSRRVADEIHPLGCSAEVYFWSFLSAAFLFTLGAVFAIVEGIHKLIHPNSLRHLPLALGVLLVSMAVEAFSFRLVRRRTAGERHGRSVLQTLRRSRKSELVVVFLENWAALAGLTVATVFLLLEWLTGILVFDALASIVIGLFLGAVALFMGAEIRSLLAGEGADPVLLAGVSQLLRREESIRRLIHLRSLRLGPDNVLLAARIEFDDHLNAAEVGRLIEGIETDVRRDFPTVSKIYVEPDLFRPV